MANNENLIPIPGRLHSVATEGHVSGADEIYDDTQSKLQSTINAEVQSAIGTDATAGSIKGRIKAIEDSKGVANGLASLDNSGKVPSSQLPSYVDDIIEGYYYNDAFYSDSTHETLITAETGKIYVDVPSNVSYRYSGSAYVAVSNPYTPDEEDLTVTNDVIKFKDKAYDASAYSGMGRVILRKNLVNGVNTITQSMINQVNTIYVIQYDFTLGEKITVPANCVLKFDGGSISGTYTLTGTNTGIQAGLVKIFDTDITLAGSWNVAEAYPEWFGAKGDGATDCSPAFAAVINNNSINTIVVLSSGTYSITEPINLIGKTNISFISVTKEVPWRTQTRILAANNISHVFKLVDNYPSGGIPTSFAKSITIEGIYIDGNNMANVGVNCNQSVTIRNCFVRNCLQDGIVFEAMTYPVRIYNSKSEFCGRHGLYIKAPYTTFYSIEDCEFNYNDGYGMYIEDGNSSSFSSITLHGNKQGGCKVILDRQDNYSYPIFLGQLAFNSVYAEANGTLETTDENYDGNYAFRIESIRPNAEDITTFVGKLIGIVFINCVANKSTDGDYCYFSGIANVVTITCFQMNVDYTKNIAGYMGRLRIRELQLGSGLNNAALDTYKLGKTKTTGITFSKDSFNAIGSITYNEIIIGNYYHCEGYIKTADVSSISPVDETRLEFKTPYSFPIYYTNKITIVGYGMYGTNKIMFVHRPDFGNESAFIIKDDGSYFLAKDLETDKILSFNLSYVAR